MASEHSRKRFLKRDPVQSRSRALVDAVIAAFDEMLRSTEDEHKVTIESLLHRAGVSIGSFYEYFANRDSLVGMLLERVTRENFDRLLAAIDATGYTTAVGLVDAVAREVALTYAHRARTRVMVAGIGRLGLLPTITAERDRFAGELAVRLSRFLPDVPLTRCRLAVIEACDVAMGIVVSDLYRPPRPVDDTIEQLTRIARTLLGQLSESPPAPRS